MHTPMMYFLAVLNLINMVHLGLYIVGANTYDILQFKKSAGTAKQKQVSRKQPLVSVVIPAHNESLVIKRTLASVRASSYPNIEIVVIDDGSSDYTNETVRQYISELPQTKLTHYMGYEPGNASSIASDSHRHRVEYARSLQMRRRYLRQPTIRIRTMHTYQLNGGKASAMNNAIANFVSGELVMCLDADSMIHPQAIEKAVAYFEDPKIIGVAANVRVMEGHGWLSTVQRFEHMVGYRSKKFYSLSNCEFIIGGVAATYRTEVLRKVNLYDTDTMTEDIGLSMKLLANEGNREKRIVYAADVVAMTEGVQTFQQLMRQRYRWKIGSLQNLFKYRRMIMSRDHTKYNRALTLYRLPMAILSEILLMLEPLVLAYLVYLSFANHTIGILLGAYMTVTLYTLWNVWPDEHLSLKQKLRMSLTSLFIYMLFYTMDLVQITAIFKALKNHRTITHLSTAVQTWVSPTRTGGAVASFS